MQQCPPSCTSAVDLALTALSRATFSCRIASTIPVVSFGRAAASPANTLRAAASASIASDFPREEVEGRIPVVRVPVAGRPVDEHANPPFERGRPQRGVDDRAGLQGRLRSWHARGGRVPPDAAVVPTLAGWRNRLR